LNVSFPATGCQKLIEVEDENKLRLFFDKKIAQEVDGDVLGDAYKGYIFKISGGNDKQGFPMKQGVHTAARVRLLFAKGQSCYRPRRTGERKRKSVRGCVVSSELSVLNLVVVKKGDKDIEGLTDQVKPRRHGPKRASKIRKLFNLTKDDDVKSYVLRRKIVKDGQKPYYKSPKIQRLITPQRLARKRHERHVRRERYEASKVAAKEYNDLVAARFKDQRDKRAQALQKRRSASMTGKSASTTTKSASTTNKVTSTNKATTVPNPTAAASTHASTTKQATSAAKQ